MRKRILALFLLLAAGSLYGADPTFGLDRVESYLIPVWTNATLPGAHGSQWRTDMTIFNPGSSEFILDSGYANLCAVDTCAFDRLAPGEQASYDGTGNVLFTSPFTWIHVKGKPESFEGLHFNLRFKDVSRQALTYGVELPVIREADLAEEVILVSVPMQERFRQSLRIYGRMSNLNSFNMEITTPAGDLIVADEIRPVFPNEDLAGYAQVIDLARVYPVLQQHDTVRIRVTPRDESGARLWAFVSVTHDETQHVTTITPQPLAGD